jgi:hypothetical protein
MVERSYLHVDDAARWLRIMDTASRYPALPGRRRDGLFDRRDSALRRAQVRVPYTHIPGPDITDRYLPELRDTLRLGCNTTIPLGTALEQIRDETRLRNRAVQPSAAA